MDIRTILNKVKSHTPTILGSEQFSKFAVLIPLVQKKDGIYVLFEVRSQNLRVQPGEICFPGGRIEKKDKTEKDAAIRETMEELGITKSNITDVHPMDYMVSPFEMIIYPYVGFIDNVEQIKPNSSEVGEVFLVPLTYFKNTEPRIHQVNLDVQPDVNFPFDLIVGGEKYNWRQKKIDEYFYIYGNKVIWGLTAKIITHFIEMVED